MKNGPTLRQQIHCTIKKDIALYRDCLRYCAGASVAQGKRVSYIERAPLMVNNIRN